MCNVSHHLVVKVYEQEEARDAGEEGGGGDSAEYLRKAGVPRMAGACATGGRAPTGASPSRHAPMGNHLMSGQPSPLQSATLCLPVQLLGRSCSLRARSVAPWLPCRRLRPEIGR